MPRPTPTAVTPLAGRPPRALQQPLPGITPAPAIRTVTMCVPRSISRGASSFPLPAPTTRRSASCRTGLSSSAPTQVFIATTPRRPCRSRQQQVGVGAAARTACRRTCCWCTGSTSIPHRTSPAPSSSTRCWARRRTGASSSPGTTSRSTAIRRRAIPSRRSSTRTVLSNTSTQPAHPLALAQRSASR